MSSLYVIPRPGFAVVDPDRRDHLPAAGRAVPDSAYWRRQMHFGDVTLGEDPETAAADPVTDETEPKAPVPIGDPDPIPADPATAAGANQEVAG